MGELESFRLAKRGEEASLAVAGLTRAGRHESFDPLALRVKAMPKGKIVAWVVGPGGVSYHLSEPDAKGKQRIKRYIQNFTGRVPTEHVELQELLERSGHAHELHVVDVSERNLQLARDALRKFGKDAAGVSFHHANIAENLPEGPDPHVIACHNVLFYMSPQVAGETLGKLWERLAPGGVLAISQKDEEHMGHGRLTTYALHARIETHGEDLLLVKR